MEGQRNKMDPHWGEDERSTRCTFRACCRWASSPPAPMHRPGEQDRLARQVDVHTTRGRVRPFLHGESGHHGRMGRRQAGPGCGREAARLMSYEAARLAGYEASRLRGYGPKGQTVAKRPRGQEAARPRSCAARLPVPVASGQDPAACRAVLQAGRLQRERHA